MTNSLIHGDPGLQPERTILAWNRTTVSLAVCSAILLRWTGFYGSAVLVPVVGLLFLAMFILFTQRIRYQRQVTGLVSDATPPNLTGVATLSSTLVIFGAIGIFFVISH